MAAKRLYFIIALILVSIVVSSCRGGGSSSSSSNTPPAAPTGVQAIPGNNQVILSWDTNTSAVSYNVYWSTTYGVPPTTGTKISSVTSPYTQTGLINGTTYYYVLTAVNSYGESSASAEVSATPGIVTIPTGVTVSPGDGQNTIRWNTVTGATSYNIYWSTSSGVSTTNGTKISYTISPYTHTGLTNRTTYYYVVTAVNAYAESAESSEVNATPNAITTLASGLSRPSAIAVDSTSVYWTEDTGGTVKKVGINGGTVTTLDSGLIDPLGIAVDSTYVYWTVIGSGVVKQTLLSGGTVTTLASGLDEPLGIVVDSTSVYWTEYGGYAVKKVGINGGAVTTLASGLNYPFCITVDSTSVYWAERDTIKKVGINGGAVTTLAAGLSGPFAIVVDSTSVYWTEGIGGTVKKVGIDGGTATTLASGLSEPIAIVVDSTNVYWTDFGAVKKASK